MATIQDDRRVDPRLKALFAMVPVISQSDVASRQEMLDEVNRPEAIAVREQMTATLEMLDDHINAPAAGLDISTVEFDSQPDGNAVKLQVIRPTSDLPLPCVYYIHGGGMQSTSCYRRDLPIVGPDDRQPGRRRRDGRLPQLPDTVVGARGRAVPGGPQRLCQRA